MKRPFILPYKAGSKAAKALSLALGCKRLKLQNSTFQHTARKCVVNWGNNDVNLLRQLVGPNYLGLNCGITAGGEAVVKVATDKLKFFKRMNSADIEAIPMWTTHKEVAMQWCRDGHVAVCREMLNASGGRGITVASTPEEVTQAPLYTQYIKKQAEYRVHVFNGEVIDVQKKMRKANVPDAEVNWKIRNHDNGFIFGRDGIDIPDDLCDLAKRCVDVLSLDFGAVDLIWNQHENKSYLLEVNTAPGLEGTTLEKYSQAVRNFCQ